MSFSYLKQLPTPEEIKQTYPLNNTCKKIGDKQLQYGEIDYFTIVAKPKKYNSIHIQKIWITNGKIQNEKFECHDTNDIKELNKVFIPAILDYAISLLS